MRGVRIPYRLFADAGLRFGTEAKNRKASYESLRTVAALRGRKVALVERQLANQNLLLQEPGFLDFMVAEMLEDPGLGTFIFVELPRQRERSAVRRAIFEALARGRRDVGDGDDRAAAGRFLAFFETMVEVAPGEGASRSRASGATR